MGIAANSQATSDPQQGCAAARKEVKLTQPKDKQLAPTEELKVRVEVELMEWLDNEVQRRERSRSYVINEMIRLRSKQLKRRRKA